jgi:ABC-type Zn uptake system ZnuABC Zn-binding protein ZnuA
MKAREKFVCMLTVVGLFVSTACTGASTDDDSVVANVCDSPERICLRVATTVSPITSIVEAIGGSRIQLEGIVPEGVNSHTFEPTPSVVTLLGEADLIVANGLFLEEPTLNLARANKQPSAVILVLGDQTIARDEWKFDFSFPEADGRPNPHLWPDPLLALRYAELVRDTMSTLDPQGADEFASNYATFSDRIATLDEAISRAIATIPESGRQLLTYHDSWAYFAERYGLEVVGAAQPSDFSEPSAREVVDLIKQLRELKVGVVFGSEVFPSQVLEQVAAETGAIYVDDLRDDDLPGVPGDPLHSYIGLMLQNVRIMIPALGGSVESLDGVDTSPTFDGPSFTRYPQ